MEITQLKVPEWEKYDGLLHGFMGRRGGKSVGAHAGLNVSYRVGDDPKIVSQNVCDLKLALGIHEGKVVTMRQVHGDNIMEMTDRQVKEAGEADGMITTQTGLYLGVLTADCVPILLIAPRQKLAAAVHAGWRGTVAGIVAKTVRRFKELYNVEADDLEAALGPAIGACCYEVKADVAEPVMQKWPVLADRSLVARDGKSYLNLTQLNRAILEKSGVPGDRIFQIGPCTACSPDEFFSYRRERCETGRQLSVIGWLPM